MPIRHDTRRRSLRSSAARAALYAFVTALGVAPWPGQAQAQTVAQDQARQRFDIDEQPLTTALVEYARVTGTSVLFASDQLSGVRSAPLHGEYLAAEALDRMLYGTGFSAVRQADGAISLRTSSQSVTDITTSEPSTDQEIVVTGTRIRGAAPAGANVIGLDRAEIEQSGRTTVQDVLQTLPQVFPGSQGELTQLNSTAGGGNFALGSSVDLRGLGADATARRVVETIGQLLARGVRPWARPWRDDPTQPLLSLPRRSNGEQYRGVNIVTLWAVAFERAYVSPDWFTFKQALAQGGHVRKGERGAFVVFYKPLSPQTPSKDGDDTAPVRRILRGYTVFNRCQIEGLPDVEVATTPIVAGDVLARRFAGAPATVRYGGSRAYYAPGTDHIQLPPKAQFADETQFYATFAHELGHWTRHPSRLDRDFGQKRFADAGYALEELVAELCAAFVGAAIGLPSEHLEDHASYIASWLTMLENDPNAFLTAAAKAQSAADYLLPLLGESAPRDTSDT